ncbi:MAG TPA: cysteine hydrolase, partial [Pseudomonas sp.]|nr:cysteine hydrolase [Pseudomonas sp.]
MYALLILDVQVGLVHGQEKPWRCEALLATVNELMDKARNAGAPIFLARHVGPAGSPIAPDSVLTQLAPELRLAGGEVVFEKHRPNAFTRTALAEDLRALGVTGVVIGGMKTQYCVDSTCRASPVLGLEGGVGADGLSCTATAQKRAEQVVAHHNARLEGA